MKKILLTGATDGIGFETAKLLAAQGQHLLIHGRSENKLSEAETALKVSFPQARVECYRADLSKFNEIRTMLQAINSEHASIDIIINNAGVFKTSAPITPDGLDIRFVVNTFAPYLITKTLLPLLDDGGRIVNLSSAAQAPINLDAMIGRQVLNEAFQAYAQSKLAITIWTQHLAKTLKPTQVVVAVNPGSMLASKMVKEGFGVQGNDLSIGADILVRAALSEEFSVASGKYFDNDSGQFSVAHSEAKNKNKCEKIMSLIEEITTVFYVNQNV